MRASYSLSVKRSLWTTILAVCGIDPISTSTESFKKALKLETRHFYRFLQSIPFFILLMTFFFSFYFTVVSLPLYFTYWKLRPSRSVMHFLKALKWYRIQLFLHIQHLILGINFGNMHTHTHTHISNETLISTSKWTIT